MTNPDNITYDERIEFTKGLNPKEQSYDKVVLNLNQKKVIKNSWNTDRSFDEYFKYFLEAYPQYVMNVMGQLDMEYLVQFIPKEDPTTEENIIDVEAKEDGTIQSE